jgi:RNA polymerase sigma factor (sigma-70 family)
MPEIDEIILGRLASDPEAAFRLLYDRYSGPLLRFLYRFMASQARSEEILHDVFLEILKINAGDFQPGSFKSWLFTVAKNKALNSQRRYAREISVLNLHEFEAPEGDSGPREAALSRLAISETRLPADLRETWRLRREGLGYQQIAERLAIPLGTVKSRFHRLVLVLREEMEK